MLRGLVLAQIGSVVLAVLPPSMTRELQLSIPYLNIRNPDFSLAAQQSSNFILYIIVLIKV
jgi:hypothetical protein